MKISKIWQSQAIMTLVNERDGAVATPLLELPLPALPGRQLLFKDESAHASGSLKHRLARALLLQGLRAGRIGPDTPLFDASSGNTAISEAWFARLLGLKFFAVIPVTTSPGKQALIRGYGGECVPVEAGKCCKREAAHLAALNDGYFLDQFRNAALAVDWREHNVIAEMMSQLDERALPVPTWFVNGAGTGGTATCAGRHFINRGLATRLLVVDPEDSAFFDFHRCGRHPAGCLCASRVEGIGRPTVEPSFDASLVDRMLAVPDAASFAAARWLTAKLGRSVGISTGSNFIGAVHLLDDLAEGLVTTLICDDGDRYAGLLDDPERLLAQGLDITPWMRALDDWHISGCWRSPVAVQTSSCRLA